MQSLESWSRAHTEDVVSACTPYTIHHVCCRGIARLYVAVCVKYLYLDSESGCAVSLKGHTSFGTLIYVFVSLSSCLRREYRVETNISFPFQKERSCYLWNAKRSTRRYYTRRCCWPIFSVVVLRLFLLIYAYLKLAVRFPVVDVSTRHANIS